MQTNQQGFPRIAVPLVDPASGILQQTWYQFFIALYNRTGGANGNMPNPFTQITVGASPFSYTANMNAGTAFIQPGCYCSVSITRSGTSLHYGYVTRGIFPLSLGDTIQVIYTNLPPTIYFI